MERRLEQPWRVVGPIDWPDFFTTGPRCDECSSRMMLEHLEFRGNTWKCYTCYTCMIIVSSVTMVVGYHGGKGMKGKGTCNDIKGNGNDRGQGQRRRGQARGERLQEASRVGREWVG